MSQLRNIIEINEELCDGCGQCILDCAEGALELVDGKARLVGEIYCDGLGACLSGCPTGALKVIQRPAEAFNEEAVDERLASLEQGQTPAQPQPLVESPTLACGCSSSEARTLDTQAACSEAPGSQPSQLGHWPIKLQLLGPNAPFLKNADLLLLADCAAAAYPDLHAKLLGGKAVALACPKLDDAQAHILKLAQVLAGARPRSLTVVHMEVPCCKGLDYIVDQAVKATGIDIQRGSLMISREGKILQDQRAAA
jgi:ferredoxin